MNLSERIRRLIPDLRGRRVERRRGYAEGRNFEPLEQRTLMTTLYWMGAVSNNWNTSDQNWNTAPDGSGDYMAWDNTTGDDAVFVNTSPLAITIPSSINARSITFGAGDISLSGGQITLTGSPQIFTGTADVTINSAIAGSEGLCIYGEGATVALTGANTYSGDTDISGVGEIQFAGDALDALPNANLSFGSYGQGSLTVGGTLTWSQNNIIAGADASLTVSGDVTLTGGIWDFSTPSSIITITSGGSLTVDGGQLLVNDLENSGTITINSGSFELTSFAYNSGSGSITWSGGDFDLTNANLVNDGAVLLQGGSDSLTGSTIENQYGTLTWYSGNLVLSTLINDSGTVDFDAPNNFIIGTSIHNALYNYGGTFNFSAGTGTQITINNRDDNGGTFSLGAGADVSLAATDPLTGSITNAGIVHYTGADSSSAANVTNVGSGKILYDFSVGSFSATNSVSIVGQSFKPSVAGPDGVAAPGSPTTVNLTSISVGFATTDSSEWSPTCWICSAPITSLAQLDDPHNVLATSISALNTSVFGSGSYSRTYNFAPTPLDPNHTYYIYFREPQYLRCAAQSYSGGNAWDDKCQMTNLDVQFQVNLTTT